MAVRLLDTNIVSFLLKRHPVAMRYRPHLAGHTLAVSFMTVAELYEWALWANWGPGKRSRLTRVLQSFLIIHSSPALCSLWAEVRYQRRQQPIVSSDGWIAAAALIHGLELVTHNPADVHRIAGLSVITEGP